MDITEGSPRRRQLGIERLVAGEDSLVYQDVVFRKDCDGLLVIASFSESTHPKNSSPREAAAKISRSREVLAELCAMSPELKRIAETLPHKYEFCSDQGKGSVLLARLDGEEVVWLR